MISNLIFKFFSVLLILSSLLVIYSYNSVFSLLSLVCCFLFSAIILFLLECEFLALLFIVIYVGAIAILFLFAIMMLDFKKVDLSKNLIKYFPIVFFFLICLLFLIANEVTSQFKNTNIENNVFYLNNYQNWYDLIDATTDVEVYGQVLYSYFVLHFLLAGFILLMVLIGVVYLTNTFNSNEILKQSSFKQLSRHSTFFF